MKKLEDYTKSELIALETANVPDRGKSIWQSEADRLNVLFLEKGVSGKPGSISPQTIRKAELGE